MLAYAVTAGWTPERPEAVVLVGQDNLVDFNRDVRPILSNHCWPCHGTDAAAVARTGGLRLDTYDEATKERDNGHQAIVPGDTDESWLVRRIEAPEAMRMPPTYANVDPLTPAQIATLKKWIEQGAKYQKHWAYEPPTRPQPPQVQNKEWVRNPIDQFVMARLEANGLQPEPEADKATLIRRATLTLLGLPPAPEEVEAFVADTRPDAYERLIDRLLESPHYGEHQARYWLDAVRYGDTHGLHLDNKRSVWPYRDWVVRAFNDDLPFNDFTLWQIAGDLLPNPTTEQLIATGYIRMNPTTNEGGAIEAEFQAKNTFDRVDTTSTVFLGMTMACARCHDHKYDPISHEDYFSMYAFFNSTADPPLDSNAELHMPVMKAPTPKQEAILNSLNEQMAGLRAKVNVPEAVKWGREAAKTVPMAGKWEISGPYVGNGFDPAFNNAELPETDPAAAQWRDLSLADSEIKANLVGKENASAYLRTTIRIPEPYFCEIKIGSDDGVKVWGNGELLHQNKVLRGVVVDNDTVRFRLKAGENTLLIKLVNAGGTDGISVGIGDPMTRRLRTAAMLAQKPSLTPQEEATLRGEYLMFGPATGDANQYRNASAQHRQLFDSLPMTYIAQELPEPQPAHVLRRGEYDQPQQEVKRGVPSVVGELPKDAPVNRLGLAQWLIDPEHPLTTRVFVNRVWMRHFGNGIVKTVEDFGSQGEWPSHPGLLDWLAVEFMEKGWSVKQLHRMILTSSSFRQSAKVAGAKREKDPENRLISRGPRFRLDAEVLRDQSLYIAGLMNPEMGGPGVNVYQPAGLWEAVGYPTSNTARYVQDKGDVLYKRSIYLFWKRTSPPPVMAVFDAPTREACVVRRSRTNTPMQALTLMNETMYVEAARHMAERVLSEKQSDEDRLEHAFFIATSRKPKAPELAVLKDVLSGRRAEYALKPEDAKKLLQTGDSPYSTQIQQEELAAWTLLCSMILNLDEVVTQH